MAIKTPSFLPGEEGYISKKEKTVERKATEKKVRGVIRKKEVTIGKIKAFNNARGWKEISDLEI